MSDSSSSGEIAEMSDDGRDAAPVADINIQELISPRSQGGAQSPKVDPLSTAKRSIVERPAAAPAPDPNAQPLQTDIITLKIMLFQVGRNKEEAITKALRFSNLSVVRDVMKDIKEKTQVGDPTFALFLPADKEKGTKGAWFGEDMVLRNFAMQDGTVIHWKSKLRPLALKLIDDSTKKVIIDDSSTVRDICLLIASRIGIKCPDEFALCKVLPPELAKSPQWLIDEKTLHEQDITEDMELQYGKRFHYSDDYVDKDDPFTLHLLYVGSNKAIINGQYPVSQEQAVELAGLQMQIMFGNHKPKEHEGQFLDLNILLPKRYRKNQKQMERDIIKAHQQFVGNDETKAKYRYVQTVRGLGSYGTTYFECTEEIKTKGKTKKTRQILIGVTKERIVVMNPKSQEIEEEYVWKQVARWSFKGEGFVFDFGDYRTSYLEVTTTEALAMNTLISGYIDIILKELQTTTRVVEPEDDNIGVVEELTGDFGVQQFGATSTFNNPYLQGGLAGMMNGGNQQAWALPGGGMGGGISGFMSPSMETNVVDMGSAMKAAKMLSNELGTQKGMWGHKGAANEEQWDAKFDNHRTALMAGVSDILGMAKLADGKLNRQNLDVKAKDLMMNMMNMATAARALNAHNNDKAPLLDGAKAVADSVADLMALLMKNLDDPLAHDAFVAALEAAERMFQDASLLLSDPQLAQYVDKGAELLMLNCIEDVDRNMSQLTDLVSRAAEELTPAQLKELEADIGKVNAVKGFALTSLRQLVPIILDKRVPLKVDMARKTLDDLSKALVNHARKMVPGTFHNGLDDAAARVADALANLLAASQTAELRDVADVDVNTPLRHLIADAVTLKNTIGHPKKTEALLASIKEVDPQLTKVIATLKSISDDQTKQGLVQAEAGVKAALQALLLQGEFVEKNPTDVEGQKKLAALCDPLVAQLQLLEQASLPITSLNELRFNAKAVCASVMQLNTGATLALGGLDESATRQSLLQATVKVKEGFGDLLVALQQSVHDPLNLTKTINLISVLKTHIPHHSQLSTDAKKASRQITNLNERQELDLAAELVSKNIRAALVSANKVSNQSGLNSVEAALEDFDAVKAILDHNVLLVGDSLVPVEGQTREDAQALLAVSCASLNKSITNLSGAAKVGPSHLENPIRAAAVAMSQIVATLLPLCATTNDTHARQQILKAVQDVYKTTMDGVLAAKDISFAVQDGKKNVKATEILNAKQKAIQDAATFLQAQAQALNEADLQEAISGIDKAKQNLRRNLKADMTYFEASQALLGVSSAVGAGVTHLSAVARYDAPLLSSSGNVLGADAIQLLELCSLAASVAPGDDTANAILQAAKNLADGLSKLFDLAKGAVARPTGDSHHALVEAEKEILTVHLAKLTAALGVSTSAEAQQSVAKINDVLASIGNMEELASMPIDVRHEYINCTKEISKAIGAMVSSGRAGLPIENGVAAKEAAAAIRNLVAAAKCAQDSDGSLKPISLDGARLIKGCDLIIENVDDPKRAMQIAKKVTLNAYNVINNAKVLAKSEQAFRTDITRDAQNVVKTTAQLAEVAKIAAAKRSPLALQQLAKISQQLKEQTKQLEATMLTAKGVKLDDSVVVPSQTAKLLMASTQKIALHTTDIIKASSSLAIAPSAQESDVLNKATKEITTTISGVMKTANQISGSIVACEAGVLEIQKISANLEEAANQALAKKLVVPGVASTTLLQAQKETMATCKTIASHIKSLVAASQDNSENLATVVNAVVAVLPDFQTKALLVAGNIEDHYEQGQLLALSKALTDSLAGFVKAIPAVTPDDPKSTQALTQAGALTTEALGLLMTQLKEGSDVSSGLKNSEAAIRAALDLIEATLDTNFTYDQCRGDLIQAARDLASAMSGLVSLDFKNQASVQSNMNKLADAVPAFATAASHLAGTSSEELSNQLLAATKQVVSKNVEMAAQVQDLCVGKDQSAQLLKSFNEATAGLQTLLATAKDGAVSEKTILQARVTIQNAINHLNKNHMLAKTGLLDADKELMNMMVSDLQKKSTKDIKALLNTTAALSSALDHQNTEQISNAVWDFSEKIYSSVEDVVKVACRLTHQNAQVDTLQVLKGIISNCESLSGLAYNVFQHPNERESHKDKVNALAAAINKEGLQLIETIQTSSAEAVRGERELNSFKQAIKNLIENTRGTDSTAQDVMHAARQVFEVTSELVFAADSDASVEAGKKSVPAIAALLDTSRGAAALSPDPNVQDAVIESSVAVARSMIKLLEVSKLNKEDPATQSKLEEASGLVNNTLNDLVAAVNRLPGGGKLFLHMEDLDFVAENQLAQTQEAIVSCNNTLIASKKPAKAKKSLAEDIDQTDINNALLDASAAIAQATGTLVEIGTTIQKGRTAAKKSRDIRSRPIKTDPTALKALIGASVETEKAIRTLTTNTQSSTVKLQEQALSASAKSVTSATSHMVAALKAGSQQHEQGLTEKLTAANQAVAEATGLLLSATHRAASFTEETEVIVVPSTGKVRELEIQVAILKLEKAIKKEKRRLDAMVAASKQG